MLQGCVMVEYFIFALAASVFAGVFSYRIIMIAYHNEKVKKLQMDEKAMSELLKELDTLNMHLKKNKMLLLDLNSEVEKINLNSKEHKETLKAEA